MGALPDCPATDPSNGLALAGATTPPKAAAAAITAKQPLLTNKGTVTSAILLESHRTNFVVQNAKVLAMLLAIELGSVKRQASPRAPHVGAPSASKPLRADQARTDLLAEGFDDGVTGDVWSLKLLALLRLLTASRCMGSPRLQHACLFGAPSRRQRLAHAARRPRTGYLPVPT